MLRINPSDVVAAYTATGLIPIRKAWESVDGRGGCPFSALAQQMGEDSGESWAGRLDEHYTRGFIDAWDADQPAILNETKNDKRYLIGYWDAIICRDAVEQTFSSEVIEYNGKADPPS